MESKANLDWKARHQDKHRPTRTHLGVCKRSERNRRCPTISQTLVYLWIKTQDDLFSLRLPRSSVCFVNSDMPLAWCFVCKLQCVGLSPESGTSLYRRKQNQPHLLFCATQQRSLPPWAATGVASQKTQHSQKAAGFTGPASRFLF